MKNLNERVDQIKKAVLTVEAERKKGQQPPTHTIRGWRESYLVKPIIRLNVDYLMYRIENSRTIRQQLRYLKNNPDLDKDFFNDPESSEVQKAQEAILLSMVDPDFEQDLVNRGQDEPVIITHEGYILNGNRRTAALKRLGIAHVECVVLPDDATKKDLYTLEHILQIAQDFKEDYHWINELINFYQGIHNRSLKYDIDQMTKTFRLTKNELTAKLRTMDLVDEFLYWKGIPNSYDYEKLDQAEQAFKELEKATKKIKDGNKRKELTHAVFHLIERPPKRGRLYQHVTSLLKQWDTLYERLLQDLEKDKGKNVTRKSATTKNKGGLVEDILASDGQTNETHIFSDSDSARNMSETIVDTVEDIKAEKKDQIDAEAVYEGISAALRELQGLCVNEASTKLEDAKNKLVQIIKVSNELLEQINKRK